MVLQLTWREESGRREEVTQFGESDMRLLVACRTVRLGSGTKRVPSGDTQPHVPKMAARAVRAAGPSTSPDPAGGCAWKADVAASKMWGGRAASTAAAALPNALPLVAAGAVALSPLKLGRCRTSDTWHISTGDNVESGSLASSGIGPACK
jgi:hypothetical protein